MCETSNRGMLTSLRKWIPSWTTSRKASRKPSPLSASIYLPCDIFLYMSQFLEFEDYRNLIEAFWPDGGEDELIRQRLWKLSTRICSVNFYNEKELKVEYNYDPKRSKEDRILLNVETLVPIAGPIFPTDTDDQLWMSPSELIDIVSTRYNMDKCSEYRYADCDCCERLYDIDTYPETFGELSGTECPYGHFHHYCIRHVSWWLKNYLRMFIKLQEVQEEELPLLLEPLPKPLLKRGNAFENMLLRCWCIPAEAGSAVIDSDSFTPATAVNEVGNHANFLRTWVMRIRIE